MDALFPPQLARNSSGRLSEMRREELDQFLQNLIDARQFLRSDFFADPAEADTWGITPSNAPERLEQRMRLIDEVSVRLPAETVARELNTQPLAALKLTLSDWWKGYIPTALMLHDKYQIHCQGKTNTAFVVGINAPPGSGKSTFVQILKFLMEIIAEKKLRVIQVGSDDLYMGKKQRKDLNMATRLHPDSLDKEFYNIIEDLKNWKPNDPPVKVPQFDKSQDDRDGYTYVSGPVDILFYEGWRVGVPESTFILPDGSMTSFNYDRLNAPIDFLMYLDADPEDVYEWKLLSSQQDHKKSRKTTSNWQPWSESQTAELRKKWDEWMGPFLKHHEAKLLSENIAHFVLTKSDAHHIVKTCLQNRERLHAVFADCKHANVDLNVDSSNPSDAASVTGLTEEESWVYHTEDMLTSPGVVKSTLEWHRYAAPPLAGYSAASSAEKVDFKCAVVDATLAQTPADAVARLSEDLGGMPDMVFAYSGSAQKLEEVAPALKGVGASMGCTSCTGVLVGKSYIRSGVSMFGLRDPSGSYIVQHSAPNLLADHSSWQAAGYDAATSARVQATALGKEPAAIFVHCSAGFEEAVLLGVADVYPGVKVFGGTAADNDFNPNAWCLLANGQTYNSGVCLTLLCPSVACAMDLNCMHKLAKLPCRGIITEAQGRKIISIDGEPAGDVYKRWCRCQDDLVGAAPSTVTTLHPLIRPPTEGDRELILMHPSHADADGNLVMFCEIQESWRISLVTSTREDLAQSAESAVQATSEGLSGVAGAIVIYCAGAVMEILRGGSDLPLSDMAKSMAGVLPEHAPLAGMFPFGEQGPAGPNPCDGNVHANLMCNVLIFHTN